MAAAVRLAAKHLKDSIGDKPLYLVGYSNGGALLIVYTLDNLDDPSLPRPDGLILLSPEIGISKAAGLAVWQGRIGHWLGLEKLAWNSISVEYDPFKYNSFAVNAGDQAYRITANIEKRMAKKSAAHALADFPKVLAFQSAVVINTRKPGQVGSVTNATEMTWPNHVFSLTHVAIPFPESDPIYGSGDGGTINTLGNLELRGERGPCLSPPTTCYASGGIRFIHGWNPKP